MNQWNIVVVDDEEIIADGLAKVIHHIGECYRVCGVFYESAAAYQYIKEHIREIDLLITDIHMPDISGLELIEKVHHIRPQLPCAVLTGFSEFQYAKRAIDLNVISYLLKPVETDALRELLNRLIVPVESDDPSSIVLSNMSRETLCMKRAVEVHFKDFDMGHLTDKLQLSRGYLFRLFKGETGMNLMDYLLDIRIQEAKKLLKQHGELKVYEISEMVGYMDYAYFSKLFRKITGMTPKSFQQHGAE